METIEYRFGNTNDKENISRLHSRLNRLREWSNQYSPADRKSRTLLSEVRFCDNRQANAPEKIRSTSSFTSLCLPRAVYMVKTDSKTTAKLSKSNLHKLKKDPQSGSKYWSVKSENMMFTRFEVPPEKVFAAHSHESEQMTYVLNGELFFEIDREVFVCGLEILFPFLPIMFTKSGLKRREQKRLIRGVRLTIITNRIVYLFTR